MKAIGYGIAAAGFAIGAALASGTTAGVLGWMATCSFVALVFTKETP